MSSEAMGKTFYISSASFAKLLKLNISAEPQVSTVSELLDRVCKEQDLDASQFRLFLQKSCLDLDTQLVSIEQAADTIQLTLEKPCLRLKGLHTPAPEARVSIDLSPSRSVTDFVAEITRVFGHYCTPLMILCGDAVIDSNAQVLGDIGIHNDDILTLVRNSDTVTAIASPTETDTIVQGFCYGQPFQFSCPIKESVTALKQRVVDFFSKNEYFTDFPPASSLRVVQGNVNFAADATIGDLSPSPVDILFQLSADDLSRTRCEALPFNCPFCAAQNAHVSLRPMCGKCTSEAILVDSRPPKRWSDVVHCTGKCSVCESKGDIFWGFFCQGLCVDTRCSTHSQRFMIAIYNSASDANELLSAINRCFSYAGVSRWPNATCVDTYVAVRLEGTTQSVPDLLDYSAVTNWDAIVADSDASVNTEAAALEVVATVPETAIRAQHVAVPDVFYTRGASGQVLKWCGLERDHFLAESTSKEAAEAGVDAVVEIPNYVGGDVEERHLVVIPRLNSGDGEGGSGTSSQPWYQRSFRLGPVTWSVLAGFGTIENMQKGMKLAERFAIKSSARAPVATSLPIYALSEQDKVDVFCSGFTTVDDVYASSKDTTAPVPASNIEEVTDESGEGDSTSGGGGAK